MFIFIEAKTTLVFSSFFQAHSMEIVSTSEHLNVLFVKLEVFLALIALILVGGVSFDPKIIENSCISELILLNKLHCVEKDVLKVSLPLHFLFKGRLKFLVCHILLSFLLEEVNDPFKRYVLSHPHHELLYSLQKEHFKVLQILLFRWILVVIYLLLLDAIYLTDRRQPELFCFLLFQMA